MIREVHGAKGACASCKVPWGSLGPLMMASMTCLFRPSSHHFCLFVLFVYLHGFSLAKAKSSLMTVFGRVKVTLASRCCSLLLCRMAESEGSCLDRDPACVRKHLQVSGCTSCQVCSEPMAPVRQAVSTGICHSQSLGDTATALLPWLGSCVVLCNCLSSLALCSAAGVLLTRCQSTLLCTRVALCLHTFFAFRVFGVLGSPVPILSVVLYIAPVGCMADTCMW